MPNETVNIYRDTFDGARTDFRMVAVRDHITQFQRGNVDFPSEIQRLEHGQTLRSTKYTTKGAVPNWCSEHMSSLICLMDSS